MTNFQNSMDSNPTPEQAALTATCAQAIHEAIGSRIHCGGTAKLARTEEILAQYFYPELARAEQAEAALAEKEKELRLEVAHYRSACRDIGSRRDLFAQQLAASQAALAEKEKELEKLGEEFVALNGYADMHMKEKARRENLEAQLAASQQRVASLESELKAAVDREGGGVGQLLSDATEEVQLARAAQKQAEADRDRYRAALEAATNYGVELGDMYNAVMTKASHDLPINDAFSLADASAKVQSGPFSLTNAMNYFKQVKALLGATEYNKITGANDTKIAALATPAAQALSEDKCICGKTANDCAVTACKPYQDGAPKP